MKRINNRADEKIMDYLSLSSFVGEKSCPMVPTIITKTSSKILDQRSRLARVFKRLDEGKDLQIVCVPSLTFNQEDIKSVVGFKHYETRSLWQLLMAKSPQIYINFVTSVDISPFIIDYYLNLLPNSDDAKKRVRILQLHKVDQDKSLVENLLNDEITLTKLKGLADKDSSFLLSFLNTGFENKLSRKLGIPSWGCLEDLEHVQTKSGNREIFAAANIKFADGFNNIKTVETLVNRIFELKEKYSESKRFVIKLDNGVSGDGNALFYFEDKYFELNDKQRKLSIIKQLEKMTFQAKGMNWATFSSKIPIGTIVELFLEGESKTSPSAQGRIHPDGSIEIISTHEQILDASGMKYLGCTFPAKSEFRSYITHQTYKIGKELKNRGVLGYFAVDFLVMSRNEKRLCYAIEINVRQGGTTHPYQTAKFLTGSTYSSSKGLLIDPKGKPIYYCSNDNLMMPERTGVSSEAFISYMQKNEIVFNKNKSEGVVFHLLSALEEYGKVGYTVIGHDPVKIREVSEKVITLAQEFYALKIKKPA